MSNALLCRREFRFDQRRFGVRQDLPVIAFLVAVVVLARSLHADLPAKPPEDYEVRSPNGQYLARIIVTPPQTTVYALQQGVEVPQWSMKGFHRTVYLADDGQHLVIGYTNLVLRPEYASKESLELASKNARDSISAWSPAVYSPDMVILQFVDRGRIIREVTLRELVPDASKMIKAVSSWHWGEFLPGLNGQGEFVVRTVDYRELHFDVKTGQLLKSQRMYRAWLRDLLWPPSRNVIPSLVMGITIGMVFRRSIRFALAINIGVSTALLVFALWVEESFASFGDEFTTGSYNFIAARAVFWLLPSSLAVVVISVLWQVVRQLKVRREQAKA